MSEDKVRAHVIVSGRVQGVFFRAETQNAAQRIGVFGWVRNKRDGSVEAVFEGTPKQVDDMIKWCWKGSPNSIVNHVLVDWETFSDEFKSFEITY